MGRRGRNRLVVIEYAENGLTGRIWTETDDILDIEHDAAGNVVRIKYSTGEELSFDYDENDNPTLMKHAGHEAQGRPYERVLKRRYDEMERLIWQQENDEAPERFGYDELGNMIKYIGKSGINIQYIHDPLGRRVGHAFTITDRLNDKTQKMLRRIEFDDNYRLITYTDGSGKHKKYRYNNLDRLVEMIFPDGNALLLDYDANGNIAKEIDQNSNEINNRYDASNRLVERHIFSKISNKSTIEHYE